MKVAGALLLLTAAAAASPPPVEAPAPVRVDHHVHVHSPAILAFLPGYCTSPGRTAPCDPLFTDPLTADDLLATLDRAGIARAAVMSTGYLAQSPMMVPPRPDAVRIMRAANDSTVELAQTHPDRLLAFVGVHPTTSAALPEIARWEGHPHVAGIKLHLTNSGVDLRAEADLVALRNVFAAARRAGLPIAIHMRTRASDYGAVDVLNFVRRVLPAADDLPVQIMHAGGWGGSGPETRAALSAFADAIERHPAATRNLWFDLAAVWDDRSTPAELSDIARLVRRIGLARFLPASDWPFSHDLVDYYDRTYPLLPLTEAEWTIIRRNVAPYARSSAR